MKIKLVTGENLYYSAKNTIGQIDNSNPDINSFVIVPDRFSLQTENLIMDELNLQSTFNIEVMGLSRLAYKILQKAGVQGSMLNNDEILLITQQAIENQKYGFKSFKKTSIGFAQEVSKVIAQIKSSGLSPDDMLSKSCPDNIKNKYHDIALIYQEYEKLIEGRLDANKLLTLFASTIEKSGILKDTNLYFVGFDSFTNEMFSLLTTLAKYSSSVTIALPKAASKGNEYIYEDDILQKLIQLCRKEKIMIEVVEKHSKLKPMQSAIINNAFCGVQEKVSSAEGFTSLLCKSISEEVMTCGKLINSHIRSGGSYHDINVACSNLEKYLPYITRIFDELDIPYFADSSISADKLFLSQGVMKFLKIVSSGYAKDALVDFFACKLNFSSATNQIVDTILRLNIKGKTKTFKYLSKLCKNMLDLFELLEKATTCQDYCVAVGKWIQFVKPNYDNLLSSMEGDYAEEQNLNVQAEKYIFNAIESIISIQAEYQISIFEFIKKLQLLLSFNQVSTVPTYVDSVMIGDATKSYFVPTKELFILSGGESLPSVIQDSGLVSDNDIEALQYVKKIEPTIKMLNRRNRFKLFNLLGLAQEKLYVSHCALNEEGKKIEKPSFITDLCNIFGRNDIKTSYLFRWLGDDYKNFVVGLGSRQHAIRVLASSKQLDNVAYSSLTKALQYDVKKLKLCRQLYTTDAKTLFFPKGYTKVTQLENYFSCPFKHFVRYGLKLKEQQDNEFDQRDIGNICHALAQKFVDQNKENLYKFEDKDVEKFVSNNIFLTIKELKLEDKLDSSDEKKALINILNRQSIMILSRIVYEQKNSKFRPIYLEKNIDGFEINIDGHDESIKMQGKVDRIDKFGDYFRILDYKTGRVDPLLKDLYYGDKLQLFIYQKGVAEMLKASPSGLYYFDCKFDFYDEENTVILKGLISNNDEVISASDTRLGVNEKSDILSVAVRKEEKDGCHFKGGAITKSSLLILQDYATKVTSKALGQLFDGYIQPKPDEHACEKCDYKGICLYCDSLGKRIKPRKNFSDIEQALKGDADE